MPTHTKEQLLVLRDVIDSKEMDTHLVEREVLEGLLSDNGTATIEHTLFALSVINMMPSIIYIKDHDGFYCIDENISVVLTHEDDPFRLMSFRIPEDTIILDLRGAVRSYIERKLLP